MRRRTFVIIVAAAGLAAGLAPRATAAETVDQRLALQLIRVATTLVEVPILTIRSLNVAVALAEEAVDLDPENVDHWRYLMRLAATAERDDLRARAVRAVARLDPDDEVARLLRLTLAIERYPSAEERIAAYRKLLEPANRSVIGDPVASRLALDLALLLRRYGDLEGFSNELAEAVAIDPANRSAAAIAAGFFRTNVNDAYGEAELLLNLMLADPTDVTTQIALARLLLENGAYTGAERFYRLATRNQEIARRVPAGNLLADRAIAHWANDRADEALHLIQDRQQERNQRSRLAALRDDPRLDPMQRAAIHGTLSPTLATVRAVIQRATGHPDAAASLAQALAAYDAEIAAREAADEPDEDQLAEVRLEKAWVSVWLGSDDAEVARLVDEADALHPLTDSARALFDGWRALRAGDLATAAARLEPLPAREAAARLGLAEVYTAEGRPRDAARALLEAARAAPGSLIGVSAANQLAARLGRRLPMSDAAHRLDTLAASVPDFFERYPDDPSLAVDLRIDTPRLLIGPYEPVVVEIVLTNNSPYPLAIDRDGPIRPQVALFVECSTPKAPDEPERKPIIVDIDRRLRLEPRARLVVPVDLRRHWVNWQLHAEALNGMFIQVRGILNFEVTSEGAIVPALLGREHVSQTMRIDGVRPTTGWREATFSAIEDPRTPDDVVLMALLGHVVARRVRLIGSLQEERESLRTSTEPAARARVVELDRLIDHNQEELVGERTPLEAAYPRLPPAGQGWLLAALPGVALLDPIRHAAQNSDERLVQLMYMIYHIVRIDDPIFARVDGSGDPSLELISEVTQHRFLQQTRIKRLPVDTGGSAAPGSGG